MAEKTRTPETVTIAGTALGLTVRRHATARRMSLRYRPLTHDILLTLPKRAALKAGLEFLHSREGWLHRQIAKHTERYPLVPGAVIPVLGKEYTLRQDAALRGLVRSQGAEIHVPGDPAFFTRRVKDWLKKQLLAEIQTLAHANAAQLGASIRSISLRDATSRWGSCSAQGDLMFSWRMVFAPHEVLTYLVAHEAAHLREMNHSPRFWALVEQLYPGYRTPQRWLKREGERLYRYG